MRLRIAYFRGCCFVTRKGVINRLDKLMVWEHTHRPDDRRERQADAPSRGRGRLIPGRHAINLTTGKDRVVGRLGGEITLASIDSAGLVYASNGYGAFKAGDGTVVFVPFAKVAAAVS